MKQVVMVVAGIIWFGVIFFVALWATFPSDAVTQRVAVEVFEASGGEYLIEIGSVAPWWVGLSAKDVKVFTRDPRARTPEDGEPELAFYAERARVRGGLGSLLARTPAVSGSVTLGSGDVAFDVTTMMNKKGTELALAEANFEAEQFPLVELAPLLGVAVEGTGAVDIDVKLEAPEGLRKASGRAKISGSGLNLTDMELPGVGPLGMEVPIDDIDIAIDITEGKAKFTKGRIVSALAAIDLDGELTLREDMNRSTMRIQIVAGSLGDSIAGIVGAVAKDAKWEDGDYHWMCTGTLSRPRCMAERERRSSSSRSSRPVPSPSSATRPDPTELAERRTTSGDDAAERERRKEEIRERLRKRREERENSVAKRPDDDFDDEEEEFDDEEDLEFEDDLEDDWGDPVDPENLFGEEGDWGDLEELFED